MVQLCSHCEVSDALSALSTGGWMCLTPDKNAALAGLSSFQLIPLQLMDLGSVGCKKSCVGTAGTLEQPLWVGCRSFSSSSTFFPKGEKKETLTSVSSV